MPPVRVDFYLLESNKPDTRWFVACRLLEKAYNKGHTVYVYCDDQQQAERLDEMLWTFKEECFIPHNLQGEGPYQPPPIQLGYQQAPRGFNDILMNVSSQIPVFFNQFKRVIELVSNEETQKEQSREHFKAYRAQRCDLHVHHID